MTANPPQQPEPFVAKPLSEVEFRYYCSGFHRALKRYRAMTIIGWVVVVIGCASFPVGWSLGRHAGIIEIVLSCMVIVAGLAIVWQSISSLESYTNIVLPASHIDEMHPMVREVLEIMKDVDDGGWQEAYGAMRKMEKLQAKHSLQPFR